jgi:hypothetical protein
VRVAPLVKLLEREGGVNPSSAADDSDAVRIFLRFEGGLGRCARGGEEVEAPLRLIVDGSTERARSPLPLDVGSGLESVKFPKVERMEPGASMGVKMLPRLRGFSFRMAASVLSRGGLIGASSAFSWDPTELRSEPCCGCGGCTK